MCCGGKETEVDGTVDAELEEAGERRKVVLLAMLEDKETIGFEPMGIEYQGRQLGELSQSIGGIGEDKLERLCWRVAEVAEDIATNQLMIGTRNAKLFANLLDELLLRASHLDTDDRRSPAAEQLEADAASAAEEVECAKTLEVHPALQDVEERLLGQICSRSGLQIARWVETSATILASDNFHYS